MAGGPAVVGLVVVVALFALGLPLATGASNATLKVTLAVWSQRIAADARSLQVSAQQRHPRQLMTLAAGFRADALRARRALKAIRPSTARGTRARSLALAAFAKYATVGRDWALVGQARLRKQRAAAVRYAHLAKTQALQGGKLLIAAGKLLA